MIIGTLKNCENCRQIKCKCSKQIGRVIESKQQRLERQSKAFKKHLREMKKSVKEMWARKVQIDASKHFNYNDVVIS